MTYIPPKAITAQETDKMSVEKIKPFQRKIRRNQLRKILTTSAKITTPRRCLIFPSPARILRLMDAQQEKINAGDAHCSIYPENLKSSPKRSTEISCPNTVKNTAIIIAKAPKYVYITCWSSQNFLLSCLVESSVVSGNKSPNIGVTIKVNAIKSAWKLEKNPEA